jgi:hypothetical protein
MRRRRRNYPPAVVRAGSAVGLQLRVRFVPAGGGLYTARAQENLRAPPPREGGGLITEAIRTAFAVHAVEAVGATHGILALAVQSKRGYASYQTRPPR